jgi:moderate conductance mechanosensitive channel
MRFSERLLQQLTNPERWLGWGESAIRILFVILMAWVFSLIAQRLVVRLRVYAFRVMNRHGADSNPDAERRAATITGALRKVINFCIWVVALIIVLADLNFRIEPILASLGVAGLAVGLGANSLIKDWLGGLFLLLEDQARIGDSVTINGISGAVEEINLRTTILRGENGAISVIANGSITSLANFSRDYSYFVFEATLAHGSDAERGLKIVEEISRELQAEEPFKSMILAPIEVAGITRLADRGVTIKARIKTVTGKNGDVGAELNRRARLKLATEKISFPAFVLP